MKPNRPLILAGVVGLSLLATNCSADDGPAARAGRSTSTDARPFIVDYSPTLSDVPALMFLATHADVELLAVTLAGTGESDCEPGVRNTRALLAIAGWPEVPVACGREEPMVGDRDWPEAFRQASNDLNGMVLPGLPAAEPLDAEEVLVRSLREADEPVTIVTLGPLTNIGLVLEAEPELAEQIDSVVTMGGAFDVPGNVEDSPDAEWNLYIDPESVRAVLDSGVPMTFVPLDATNAVPGNAGIFARLAATATVPAGETVRQLWAANLSSITSDFWYFWDELAAVVAMEPSVATIEKLPVVMADSGATLTRDDGVMASVATAADAGRFEQHFLETFAGGPLPVAELSPADEQYLAVLTGAMAELNDEIGRVFVEIEERMAQAPADQVMLEFTEGMFGGIATLKAGLAGVEVPPDYRSSHDVLVDHTDRMLDDEPEFVAAIEAGAPPEMLTVELFWEIFEQATLGTGMQDLFDGFDAACADLELIAYTNGATSEICVFA